MASANTIVWANAVEASAMMVSAPMKNAPINVRAEQLPETADRHHEEGAHEVDVADVRIDAQHLISAPASPAISAPLVNTSL